jgi:hypothetical protein
MGKARGLRQLYGASEGAVQNRSVYAVPAASESPNQNFSPRWASKLQTLDMEKMGVEVPFALLTPRIIFKSVRCCGHGKQERTKTRSQKAA